MTKIIDRINPHKGYVLVELANNPDIDIHCCDDSIDMVLGRVINCGFSSHTSGMPYYKVGTFVVFNTKMATVVRTHPNSTKKVSYYLVNNSGIICSVCLDADQYIVERHFYDDIVLKASNEGLTSEDAEYVAETISRQLHTYSDDMTCPLSILIQNIKDNYNK